MMTEHGYVEEAMLEWLAGKDEDPNDHGLGWTYRAEADMEVYRRSLTLAQQVPALRIIIDHVAGVAVDGKAPPADWLAKMKMLARRLKVSRNVSGLVEATGRAEETAPRDMEFYRPVLGWVQRDESMQ